MHLRNTVESMYPIANQQFAPERKPNLFQQLFLAMQAFFKSVNGVF